MSINSTSGERKRFNLSRWAIAHPSIARFLFGLIIIAGALGLTHMGQKEDPDFTFRVMVVQTVWPGASLQDMEDQVVNKIERKLQETPHLDWVKSYTRAGFAITTIQIKGDTNTAEVKDAFYQIRKKVGDIGNELPSGLLGPYFNDEFGDTFITLHSISGDGYTYPELKKFAIQARDMLLSTPGVEKATIIGDQAEQIYIDVSSKVLAERGLTLNDLKNAIIGQNNVDPAGNVDTSTRSVRISVEGDVNKIEDIKNLRLNAGGQVTRLGDIATVTAGLQDPYTAKFLYNGHPSVQLGVVMAPGFKVTDVGTSVEETYKRFEASLPVGVQVDQIANQPDVVTDAISEFMHALGEALVIVLIVSFLSIGWRSGLVIAIAIPLVLAATFAIMYELGIDLQRISLGALIIALGLLVDDAMIVVELMERKLEEGLVKLDAASFAYSSTAFPMLTGTLITTAGFIPVGFAASTAGEYVRSLFYVVGIALVVSWFVAVYFTPWLGYMILKQRHHAGEHHDVFDTRFYRRLHSSVAWAVRHRVIVLLLTLAAFVGSLWSFQFIPQNFFPQSSRPEILVDLWLPEGTSIKEVERQAQALEARMADDPDKRFIATYVGQGAPRFFLPLDQQLTNPNYAQMLVMAKDEPARERLITKMRGILAADFPSVRGKVDRLFLGPPTGWPVQLRVMGPDRQEVRRIADEVKQRFTQNPLLGAIHDDWLEPVPAMKLVIDQDRARALGVTSQRIRQMLQASMSGFTLDNYREGEETVGIVAREPDASRHLLTSVNSVYIPTDSGGFVPLSQVAKIVPVMEQSIEWRRDRLPTISVRATLPDNVQSNDVTAKLYNDMADLRSSLPAGYKIEIQGGAEDSAESQASIAAKAPIMLVIIVVLLMAQLQHFGKAMLVLATGPLGIIGAAGALLISGAPFGFVAILGVIALLGIIIRNSIILVDQIDQDIAAGMDRKEAIIGSAVRRFRPIMLTALTAVLALIPISRGVFWGPLAYAMMGGILVATVLTIFVLPAGYALFFGRDPKSKSAEPVVSEQADEEEGNTVQLPPAVAAE
ncbi:MULTISPECIES: efflux RND transporter permease subunit [Rhizobium]|uniref:Efflux RND transporter permease subunit n=1 Tax=Rhizobium tropici TaxID=398 RepID=A0A6P1CB69_RHITR|nr:MULTISPECIES: efflux RND transporter permease subunit [Rhizobium]AGB72557.1 resistance nodulation cell division (RND) drug efflux pump, inner membrane component [Rhizobium tropici CIAT 899]MBB4244758.1 multidrug efflux pump subunit AcrB [Rhizobium tropici]MBB5596145.1 multidrug efflux pump subunit AcrB [Rhizobium tropici]MBB6495111.1 multidrug efflux pump subunit AcrB [Rhizobium tropici]NEV13671.1 efflux RND transporter permease subunit [Rhizobium tropici]